MIKKNALTCFYFLLLTICFSSCDKNKYPGCTITSPGNEQVFTGGMTVNISVEMHDDGDALTTQDLFVVKDNGGSDAAVKHKQHDFLFGKYILNESFIANRIPGIKYWHQPGEDMGEISWILYLLNRIKN